MDVEGQVSPSRNRYRSKVDAWLAAMLIGAFLLTLLLTLAEVFSSAWWIVLLVFAVWGFVLSLLFPLYYEITPSSLLVRSGWIRREIPLTCIQRVFPARNPLSAPALSLDRLQVDYTRGSLPRFVLISPRDTTGFLRNLAESAGSLEMQGDRLVRS